MSFSSHLSNKNNGFTLVEISIVMIIIGLLIGGTFGGMKLVENMQVNKTVQDLKAIESAALTFKDPYGRLPGDLRNPATRLPNCTVAPCATGGDGNRILGDGGYAGFTVTATDERFTFWSQLQASDIVSIGVKNVTTLDFGEGQPEAPVGGGYKMGYSGSAGAAAHGIPRPFPRHTIFVTGSPEVWLTPAPQSVSCPQTISIDRKMDDGAPLSGAVMLWTYGNCMTGPPYAYALPPTGSSPAMIEYYARF